MLDCTIQTELPTPKAYGELQEAFGYFNTLLFHGHLPPVLFTLVRKKRVRGYFGPGRFAERQTKEEDWPGQADGISAAAGDNYIPPSKDPAKIDEIAMNPDTFEGRTDREILSTVVHEMAHLWQDKFGKPSRRGYHNAEWGAKMKEIGLHPSDTGEPGGKETGQQMTHYIVEGGPFDRHCAALLDGGFRLTFGSSVAELAGKAGKSNKSNRVKYTCPTCQANVWGKAGLLIGCKECEELYTEGE